MNEQELIQEKSHLDSVLRKLGKAKSKLENVINNLGIGNLERLKELRDSPEKGMDFAYFLEQLQEKNQSMNIQGKFNRLDEFGYMAQEPYFSRIDLEEPNTGELTTAYIGKYGYTEKEPVITDWRAKVASVYYKYRYPQKNVKYETPEGEVIKDLNLKRTYEIESGELIRYYNNDIQLDENSIVIGKIKKRTGGVLEDIVETIQKDQMDIIESDPRQLCIVQGCVGSGKSTVAIHKLSHIFFNYPNVIKSNRAILVAKNQILVGYLSTLFPKLGIFDINFKTLRDLVVNLIYREELPIKYNLDSGQDTSEYGIKFIKKLDSQIIKIQKTTEDKINKIFSHPDYLPFKSYKYSYNQTPDENITEILSDLQEEISSQTEFIKENPSSIRVILCKDNVRNLRKIIRSLNSISSELRTSVMKNILKQVNVDPELELSYGKVLVYLEVFSRIIGITKFIPYEYCVVDEGQDFSILEYLIISKTVIRGRMGIFGDLNQGIESDGITKWDDIKEVISDVKSANIFELKKNYRSTDEIISLANGILRRYTNAHLPESIHRTGKEPEIIRVPSHEELISGFLKQLSSDIKMHDKTVGIISFNDELMNIIRNSIIKQHPDAELTELNASKRIHYTPKGIYLMNVDNCKGLEFSKVYVLDLNLEDIKDIMDARKAFVACTRAMNELVVYGVENKKD